MLRASSGDMMHDARGLSDGSIAPGMRKMYEKGNFAPERQSTHLIGLFREGQRNCFSDSVNGQE